MSLEYHFMCRIETHNLPDEVTDGHWDLCGNADWVLDQNDEKTSDIWGIVSVIGTA